MMPGRRGRLDDLYDAAELTAATHTHARSLVRLLPGLSPVEVYMNLNAVAPSRAAAPADGVRYVFLRTGEQTGGAHEVIEAFVPPGGEGPPASHHRQENLFLVVEGQVEFSLGCERIEVGPSGTAYAPHGVPHHFVNVGSTPARVIIAARPASCRCRREQRPPNGTN